MRANRLAPAVSLALLAALGSGAAVTGCQDPDQFLPAGQSGAPAGVLAGTVTYAGPLPCTEDQHIVGAAVFLIFDTHLLPPPEGLGTTAQSLADVPGETLFAGVRDRLTFEKDGSRWCPAAGSAPVTVSADWAAGPLPGGVYEVRSFYDLDGNFDPVFSIEKLPTKGDIAGGAIDNAAGVLAGQAPVYRQIALGAEQKDGTRKIPDDGARIGGISVTLALPLPLTLPTFYPKAVTYSAQACKGGAIVDAPKKTADPTKVTMPSDYTLPVFDSTNPGGTETSITRIDLAAGVPASEQKAAAAPPFSLPVGSGSSPGFDFTWWDFNGDGMISIAEDHTPASSLIPTLFPLAILSKLDAKQGDLVAQASPAVIIQGITIYKSLISTAAIGLSGNTTFHDTQPDVIVGVPPAAVCLDPADPSKPATLLLSHETDCTGHKILTDEPGTLAALKKQFGREVKLAIGCLPQGRYATNLVYGTGQAWTVPNEGGICAAAEPETKDGKSCETDSDGVSFKRALLPSQDGIFIVGEPDDASWCKDHPTPAACLPSK